NGQRRKKRLGLALITVAFCTLGGGIALAASSWISGDAAPPEVAEDFAGYRPELGFNPEPANGRRVATDGNVDLFATTNAQGSYCLVVSTPWKRPASLRSGGTCVSRAAAESVVSFGLVAAASHDDRETTLVLAGRAADPQARTIQLTTPDGDELSRPVGTSGFFVVSLKTVPCADGDWTGPLRILDSDGQTIIDARGTIAAAGKGTCAFRGPRAFWP
ncbi:MAG: hypothetical protein M3304_08840, partial [Actinomycetota bacterium]|nr:hypothetical protein [Actinomycetota bacterium]